MFNPGLPDPKLLREREPRQLVVLTYETKWSKK
jgi:hypothetical protein